MYLGSIVEAGATDAALDDPAHPCAEAPVSAIPVPDPDPDAPRRRIVPTGEIADGAMPAACNIASRRLRSGERPGLRLLPDGRPVARHLPRAGGSP